MSPKQKTTLEIAKIKNLPPLPEASVRIITAVNDPDISIDELVAVIILSPVLVARLLGLANAAYFGRSGKITDIRIAIIQVLGLNLVKSLALSIVLNVELDTTKCKLFDTSFFWNHALVTALTAQKFAVHINDDLMLPNTVYTSGLLLNIGLLAAVYVFPTQCDEVFANADGTEGSVSKHMNLILGQTHYDVGAVLLEKWQLPSVYQTIIKEFRQPGFNGQEKNLLLLLELSHAISTLIVNEIHEELPDFSNLLNQLNLPIELLENIVNDVVKNKNNISELANIISG